MSTNHMSHVSKILASAGMTTRRHLLGSVLAGAGALGISSIAAAAPPSAPKTPSSTAFPTGDVHDFDFLHGTWENVNRRLTKRWVGSNDWDVFPGRYTCESRLGGIVNIEQVDFPTKGWSGVTLRTFDVEKRQWSIYWINSRTGVLFPPVVGGFIGDRGEFYGDDTDDGRPVKVRFIWTRLGPDHAHWQQAFSLDGKEWETNWTNENRRVKR